MGGQKKQMTINFSVFHIFVDNEKISFRGVVD